MLVKLLDSIRDGMPTDSL